MSTSEYRQQYLEGAAAVRADVCQLSRSSLTYVVRG